MIFILNIKSMSFLSINIIYSDVNMGYSRYRTFPYPDYFLKYNLIIESYMNIKEF